MSLPHHNSIYDQSHVEASTANARVTDFVFADEAVIIAGLLEFVVLALEALHKEGKPLGLQVSWAKTKAQVLGGLLNEPVKSIHACVEDIEFLESYICFCGMVHSSGGACQEVLTWIGVAKAVMGSLNTSS